MTIIEARDNCRHEFEFFADAREWMVEHQPRKCWLVDDNGVRATIEYEEPWTPESAELALLDAEDTLRDHIAAMREDEDDARRDDIRAWERDR